MQFVPGEQVCEAVGGLLRRGDRLAIASPWVTALEVVCGPERLDELARAGGKLRLLVRHAVPEHLELADVGALADLRRRWPDVIEVRGHPSLHAKLYLVERPPAVVVTSANLPGFGASEGNAESGVLLDGEQARPYVEQFEELWAEGHALDFGSMAPAPPPERVSPERVRLPDEGQGLLLGHALDGGEEVRLGLDALPCHLAVVGATGSGKTGALVGVIEEAALAGTPVLVFDPKGDLGCLLLGAASDTTLRGLDLRDVDCPRETVTGWPEACAAAGVGTERRAALQQRAHVRLLTPGSPLAPCDLLSGLLDVAGPDGEAGEHVVAQRVTTLFRLLRFPDHDVTSPEHVLVSCLLEHARRRAVPIELAQLAPWIERPPFDQLGGRALEQVLPRAERRRLARAFYAALEAPSLRTWRRGPPLRAAELVRPVEGRAPVTVVSLTHLAGGQARHAAAACVLNEVWAWASRQPGKARAPRLLVVIDECDWAPPCNRKAPPTRDVLLELLQRGRAFGLGVVLGLQGPTQLDHQAFANVNTYVVGRLASAHDQRRVLDALVRDARGETEREVGRALAQLGPRQFILASAGASPVTFRPRHTLSPLLGPLPTSLLAQLASKPVPAGPAGPDAVAPPRRDSVELPTPASTPLALPSPASEFVSRRDGTTLDVEVRFRDEARGIADDRRLTLVRASERWQAEDGRTLDDLRRGERFRVAPALGWWAPAAMGEAAFQTEHARRLRAHARRAAEDVRARGRARLEPLERELLSTSGRAFDELRGVAADLLLAVLAVAGWALALLVVLFRRRGGRTPPRLQLARRRSDRRIFERSAQALALLVRLARERRRLRLDARAAADAALRAGERVDVVHLVSKVVELGSAPSLLHDHGARPPALEGNEAA